MHSIALSFANASCAHCARIVTRTLQTAEGIWSVDVDQTGQRVLVDFDPTRISIEAIRALMRGAGYPTRLVDGAPVPLYARAA